MCAWLVCVVIGCVISQPLNTGNDCSSGLDQELQMYEDIRRRLVLHDADIAEMRSRYDSGIADINTRHEADIAQKDAEITQMKNRHDSDIAQLQDTMANMAGSTATGMVMNGYGHIARYGYECLRTHSFGFGTSVT
jgi:hypothetical protein